MDAVETFKTLRGFNNVEKRNWFNFPEDRLTSRPNTRLNTIVVGGGVKDRSDQLEQERARLEVRVLLSDSGNVAVE